MDARAKLLLNFNVPETSLDSMLYKVTVVQHGYTLILRKIKFNYHY